MWLFLHVIWSRKYVPLSRFRFSYLYRPCCQQQNAACDRTPLCGYDQLIHKEKAHDFGEGRTGLSMGILAISNMVLLFCVAQQIVHMIIVKFMLHRFILVKFISFVLLHIDLQLYYLSD